MDFQETIAQIGKSTLMSVGAREFVSSPDSLTFKVGRGDRKVTITLDPSDTYSLKTVLIRNWRTVYEVAGVYCDQLAEAVYQSHLELNKREKVAQ